MSAPRVRQATRDDLPAVDALWSRLVTEEATLGPATAPDPAALASWRASFERHLGRFTFLWVAEGSAGVDGFLLARLKARPPYLGSEVVGELSSIFVGPSIRRRGAGSALVQEAIAALRLQGAKAIEVEIKEGNAAAARFWEAQHFSTRMRVCRLDDGR